MRCACHRKFVTHEKIIAYRLEWIYSDGQRERPLPEGAVHGHTRVLSDMAGVSAGGAAVCCCCVSEEEGQKPPAFESRNDPQSRLAITLSRAESPAPLAARSDPSGVYKPTRNAPLGQSLFTPCGQAPWDSLRATEEVCGRFFLRPRGGCESGPPEAASVDFSFLPMSKHV